MHVDVLIVGAGISGIDAAYHLQTRCPRRSYAIVEARSAIGGTWDLFRYPGIRSDSDMFTLGFPFRPWKGDLSIADGASILAYIRETAAAYGIDKKITFDRTVVAARWSSADARWTIDARDSSGALHAITCSFLFACSGYYDYAKGYTPDFPGRERFAGPIIHPQHWPDDLDYTGKRVIVIGSGATAVTLVPELAKRAGHVTMLQRSPSYVLSLPARDRIAHWLRGKLPHATAASLTRWKSVLFTMGSYAYSRKYPEAMRKFLLSQVAKHTAGKVDMAHFSPSYKPWDQRLCIVPDSDLFEALKAGSASIVTDHIDTFTESGIKLRSGELLPADIIVTATGLVLRVFGGASLEVDGERIDPPSTMVYKGMMCSDVPNFAFATGYTNASWTLKTDLTSQFVCRLLTFMDEQGVTRAVPRRSPDVTAEPLLDFTSGYVQRAISAFPRQGSVVPWKLYQNYIRDLWVIRRARMDAPELELTRKP